MLEYKGLWRKYSGDIMRNSLTTILNSKKKTLWLLIGMVAFLTILYFIICLIFKTNYTVGGDSYYQYQNFFCNYIEKIKNAKLSFYNFDNLYGTSIYADAYYVPLNLEFVFVLLSSYFMNVDLAYSTYQFLKFGMAFISFYCLLSYTEKRSVKTSLLFSCFWIFSGFACAYVLYPTYFNILIYLPIMIIVLKSDLKYKKILLTLFSLYVTISCFYVSYILFAGVCLFMIYDAYINRTNLKTFLKNILTVVFHILLGVALSSFLTIPSLTYILKYSQFIKEEKYGPFIFKPDKYFYLILSVFKIPLKGILNYESQDYVFHEGMLYFGLVPLLFLIMIFQNEAYKRYRVPIYVELILLSIPLFSMILTGTTVPYSRWYALPLFINLLISSTVFENEFEKVDIGFSNSNRLIVIVSSSAVVVNLAFIILISANTLVCENGSKLFCCFSSVLSLIFFIGIILKKGQIITLKRMMILESLGVTLLFFLSFMSVSRANQMNFQREEISSLLEQSSTEENSKIYLYSDSKIFNQNSYYRNYLFDNGIYYHSFYNKNIDLFIKECENAGKSGWTKYTSDGNLILSSFLGYDYFVVENQYDTLKKCDYFEYVSGDDYYTLYKTKYDSNIFEFITYIEKLPKAEVGKGILFNDLKLFNVSTKDIDYSNYSNEDMICVGTESINSKKYYKYELLNQKENIAGCNLFLLTVGSINHSGFIEFEDGTRTTYHDNFGYDYKLPKYIYIDEKYNNYKINLERVNLQCFEQILSKQSEYNKSLELNGSSIHIKMASENTEEGYICLPITYSDEWKTSGNEVEIIRLNDSFIGIKVSDLSNVDVVLNFEPSGYNLGLKIEKIIIPLVFLIFSFEVMLSFRKKENLF